MGSQVIQGQLWGKQPKDWATIQEQTGHAGYEYVLNFLQLTPADKLLDVGCGSGLFCSLVVLEDADAQGIDASEQLIEEAKKRIRSVKFTTGEMEELPFADNTFNIVCGFNSFQFAANLNNALNEAKRVLKENGKLAAMIFGNKKDCEASTFIKAVSSLMPPLSHQAPGPFDLSENQVLEKAVEETGPKIIHKTDIVAICEYPNLEIAIKGMMSASPVGRAIDHIGFEKVHETMLNAIQPFIQSNGHVVYNNKLRIAISEDGH